MSCEDIAENIATENDMQRYIEKLRERIQSYKDENAKMDIIIEKLRILMHENLEYLSILKGTLDVDEISRDCCVLSEQERLRKHNYYTSKIKCCTKMYTNLNERLLKDIKTIKLEIEHSRSKLAGVNVASVDEIKYLEAKVKRYENELIKLEKKYPWLKNPHLNLPDISEQIEKLNNLRYTKEKLVEDLAMYKGLKPDIAQANEQLKEVKQDYEKIMEEFKKF